MTIQYQIEFFTDWHAGSGLSGGVYADGLVIKDRDRLPFIPGRTLKGLLRDAGQKINQFQPQLINTDFLNRVFGESSETGQVAYRKWPRQGEAFFGNAELSDHVRHQLKAEPALTSQLYRVLSSTAIGANGLALDRSLRRLEVTVPLTLYAEIAQFPDEPEALPQLEYCLQGVKRLGQNRSRGLGRCQLIRIKKSS